MHQVPNVQGLIRSEMMIVVGLILARLRRLRFPEHEAFPVSPVVISSSKLKITNKVFLFQVMILSLIGRDARIIQAHFCPRDLRLKVRYSQLVDFSHYTTAQADLFTRWLLCEPLAEPQPPPDAEEPSKIHHSKRAPPEPALRHTTTLRSGIYDRGSLSCFGPATRAMIEVA